MAPPSPLHRHQSSLESVLDYSARSPLELNVRNEAKRRLELIVGHFETTEAGSSGSQYSRPRLILLTYQYALSEEARDNFLRAFFIAIQLAIDSQDDIDFDKHRSAFFDFADHLLDNFFLPLMASTGRTPQPSPASYSAIQQVAGIQDFVGTEQRVSALRTACLIRDKHRCVVSQRFDREEYINRMERDSDNAHDDEGIPLAGDPRQLAKLEVAHILPHSLTKTNVNSQLDPSREAALMVLNMFDTGVVRLIEGPDIDRPRNAITLTSDLHPYFGRFRIFFESISNKPPHTYKIDAFLPRFTFPELPFPIIRTLSITDDRTIDPPSHRFLAIHRAIAHILHLSGAGRYIERLLRDAEEKGIQSDGSTDLGRLLKLGLGGWLDNAVYI